MVVEMVFETLPYVLWNTIFAYYNDINEFCNPLFTDSDFLILHCL